MSRNYYRAARIIGGKMLPGRGPQFGNLGLLDATGDMLRDKVHASPVVRFTIDDDRAIWRAFEEVRKGAAPDKILYDSRLAARFCRRCRDLGVDAPHAALGRRLLNIRKNSPRYAKHGIILSPTTAKVVHPSIVPRYAHAIEFALVRLRYRYGSSIDEILLDPALASEFEDLAGQIVPGIKSVNLRLGALYIRKTRHCKKGEASLFEQLDIDSMENALDEFGSLSEVSQSKLPDGEGLIELLEHGRYLYIVHTQTIGAVLREFLQGPTLDALSNQFWHPNASSIQVRAIEGHEFHGGSMERWQLKLIRERRPVFNWPVAGRAA